MRSPYARLVRVANPAAGADITMTAPGDEWWRVLTIAFQVVTDATVANRAVALAADDGTDTFWRVGTPALQTAGQTNLYAASHGYGQAQATGGVNSLPLPGDGLWLQSGWRLRTITDQIQAGDQISAFIALVLAFNTGPGADVHAPILGQPYMEGR